MNKYLNAIFDLLVIAAFGLIVFGYLFAGAVAFALSAAALYVLCATDNTDRFAREAEFYALFWALIGGIIVSFAAAITVGWPWILIFLVCLYEVCDLVRDEESEKEDQE